MKRLFWSSALLVVVVLLPASQVEALTITPATTATATGNQTSQAQIDAYIAGILGSAEMQYKQNVGGSEVGSLATEYQTVFTNTPSNPTDATISYVGGGSYIAGPAYLLVKDGNNSPAWYLFNLTSLGWNGKETLTIQNFWTGTGAISHVTIYGTAVPEPATLSLLAAGLLGATVVRRRRSQVA
jgi:hypothetical protein